MNFFSEIFDEIQVNMKSLFDLLNDKIGFHWKIELKTIFEQNKTSITKDVVLTLPNTNHPFVISLDSPLNGTDCPIPSE